MINNKIKFIKLTKIGFGRTLQVWFRPDLITKIFTLDNITHVSYLENGEVIDYRMSETPEEILAEIEKINI